MAKRKSAEENTYNIITNHLINLPNQITDKEGYPLYHRITSRSIKKSPFGELIPDKLYHEDIEYKSISDILEKNMVRGLKSEFKKKNISLNGKLLKDLQLIHDVELFFKNKIFYLNKIYWKIKNGKY